VFQKLRLRLTLINVFIILVLFFVLIVGAYCYSQFEINRRGDFVARKIAADIQSGIISDLPSHKVRLLVPPPPLEPPPGLPSGPPPEFPRGPNFFFVKTSPSGFITFQSSSQPLSPSDLEVLTQKALQTSNQQGTLLFEETSYSYLKSPLANPPGTLVLFHDLSQATNILQTLLTALIVVGVACSLLSFGASFFMANRAMIPIQTAWQQQKNFLSDVSHELRTPLAVIQTNLDIVRGNSNETVSSQSKWLDNIQEEAVCMANLVDSLLFLARADSNQQTLEKRPFSLNAAVMRAVTALEPLASDKGLSLEAHATVPVQGYGDETRIKQVLCILLDNAIRHTPADGKITVSLTQTNTKILLTVADTGEGIEPEHLDRIFDRFYQADQSRNKGGSGLGLAIAKWIIENHGGVITVVSTPGLGTIFTITFPGVR
jgi:signal transduction histidine kinase